MTGVRALHDQRAMRSYVVAIVVGVAGMLAVFGAALMVLSARDSLPAPQFANSQCVDEKLRAMRLQPPDRPELLVVGSSVAWRHFNGDAARALGAGVRTYNAGFCKANVRQTQRATEWLVERLPTVARVVFIASPMDFEGCAAGPQVQFDIADVDDYVFGHGFAGQYYLRYFDPAALARNAATIRHARADPNTFDSVVVSPLGDGPIAPPWRGLHYGPTAPETACFAALRDFAGAMSRRGVRLDITITPMHPDWKVRYGGDGYPGALEQRIAAALRGTDARYHAQPLQPDTGNFYDAMHLRWSATGAYTRALLQEIGYPADG